MGKNNRSRKRKNKNLPKSGNTVPPANSRTTQNSDIISSSPLASKGILASAKLILVKFWKVLAGVGVLVGLLPLSYGLSFESPVPVFPDQPFSIAFEIKNDGLLPLANVRYACGFSKDIIGGGEDTDNEMIPYQKPRTLYWRDVMAGRCETMIYFGGRARFRSAGLTLTAHFRPLGLFDLTVRKPYVAVIDPATHQIVKWVPK